MNKMKKEKKLPPFPDESLKPMVITGVEALGRGQDLNELAGFLQHLAPLGPDTVMRELNINEYINRLAASLGIESKGLIKSEEQKQQEAQAQQQQMQEMQERQMIQSVADKVVPVAVKSQIQQQQ